MKLVILGLAITSSWGNERATSYRGLVRELVALGDDVLFVERDMLWYAARDLPSRHYGRTQLYLSLNQLKDRFASDIGEAHFVRVGSYVPSGVALCEWAIAAFARPRVLTEHTANYRPAQLEDYVLEVLKWRAHKSWILEIKF